jgi:hypothetical protein
MIDSAKPSEPMSDIATPRDAYIHLRLHRASTITFALSVLLHVLVLFAVRSPVLNQGGDPPAGDEGSTGPLGSAAPPMQVSMQAARPPAVPSVPSVALTPPPITAKRTPRTQRTVRARPPVPPTPPQPTPPQQTAPQATDMASYVQAQQNRRRAAQGLPPLSPGEGEGQGESVADREAREARARNARAAQNLRVGTNGIFQLISLTERSAAFAFHGWTTDAANAKREYISVQIGTNPSIELAVVRKMIELIRRHYQGNFNWESQRLDRVVVLSARLEDTDGLEEFLVREFFAGQRAEQRAEQRAGQRSGR